VTALLVAAADGHHRCVSILVASGADVNRTVEVIRWRSTIRLTFVIANRLPHLPL
jgi:hypothetical protein